MTLRTRELLALDAAHVWHPFTQMQGWPEDSPLVIERAEGNWLIDTDKHRSSFSKRILGGAWIPRGLCCGRLRPF